MAITRGRLRGLDPLIDEYTRAVVLGTFPGAESLRTGQYYADSRNGFWAILSIVHGDDYLSLPYSIRTARLLARRIGLWDVLDSCERDGSLDTAIRAPISTDVARLTSSAPCLELVLFNGAKAAREAARFVRAGYHVVTLPSSSSAFAKPLKEKAKAWEKVIPVYVPPLPPSKPIEPRKPFTARMVREAIVEGRE
jgi:hypoxanthine-DNA glycosylase